MSVIFFKLSQIDEDHQIVYGVASTETPDEQGGEWDGQYYDGDIVELSALKDALPDYMTWANLREMHQAKAIGIVLDAGVIDGQFTIAAKIVDKSAWDKVKEAVYKGFSIGGKVLGAKLIEMGGKLYRKITKLKLYEISLVDRPANPEAIITLWKAKDLSNLIGSIPKNKVRSAMSEEKNTYAVPDETIDLTKSVSDDGQAELNEALAPKNVMEIAQRLVEKRQPDSQKSGVQEETVAMLQAVRDVSEIAGDVVNAQLYTEAIALLRKNQQGGLVQVTSNHLLKSIEPVLGKIVSKLENIEHRLSRIEAQPSGNGPMLKAFQTGNLLPVAKRLAGYDVEPEPEQVDLAALRRKVATEPNPLMKMQYQTELLEAEQAQANGHRGGIR